MKFELLRVKIIKKFTCRETKNHFKLVGVHVIPGKTTVKSVSILKEVFKCSNA